MPNNRLVTFILTHGRADRVKTYSALKRSGYTGDLYLLIDNEDPQADAYRERYGDQVIQFDKKKEAETFDTADLSHDRRTIVYARNACQRIAKEMGYEYCLQLDDDYSWFGPRYPKDGVLRDPGTSNLDQVISWYIELLDSTDVLTIAFAQGGDYIGGVTSPIVKSGYKRKAMNSFFTRTNRPVRFVGRINEDVNTYVSAGNRGEVFLTHAGFYLSQEKTQQKSGGMTDVYLDGGTYLKSFYTVMFCPSAVTLQLMGEKHKRIHHNIEWRNAVPLILSSDWKKNS